MALYNTYRPQQFDEIAGQETVSSIIRNQIVKNRVGHAHLFTGTRGTGKTTLAKLMAKAVNCLHQKEDGSPCNECENCRAVAEGNSFDVIEMDAASNNGVDSIRQMLETVNYRPSAPMKYRVYIIDEVHMLSNGAFNALLKTIEEPPSHVIFILCTTEMHKVPATILSRCQKYQFERLSNHELIANMQAILAKEQVEYEAAALALIARLADGSCRDSLSLLDQILLLSKGKLKLSDVKTACGIADSSNIRNLVWFLLNENDKSLSVLQQEYDKGGDVVRMTEEIIEYLRNIMMYFHGSANVNKSLTENDIADLEKFKEISELSRLIRLIQVFSECLPSLKNSSMKKVTLEVAIMRAITPEMSIDDVSVLERVRKLEDRLGEKTA